MTGLSGFLAQELPFCDIPPFNWRNPKDQGPERKPLQGLQVPELPGARCGAVVLHHIDRASAPGRDDGRGVPVREILGGSGEKPSAVAGTMFFGWQFPTRWIHKWEDEIGCLPRWRTSKLKPSLSSEFLNSPARSRKPPICSNCSTTNLSCFDDH